MRMRAKTQGRKESSDGEYFLVTSLSRGVFARATHE